MKKQGLLALCAMMGLSGNVKAMSVESYSELADVLCGLPGGQSMEGVIAHKTDDMSEALLGRLKSDYGDVDDITFYEGIISRNTHDVAREEVADHNSDMRACRKKVALAALEEIEIG